MLHRDQSLIRKQLHTDKPFNEKVTTSLEVSLTDDQHQARIKVWSLHSILNKANFLHYP